LDFDPYKLFKPGDLRIFSIYGSPEQGIPFAEVPCRLVEKLVNDDKSVVWSYEDLRTGAVHRWYSNYSFSLRKLTEMEAVAMASR
jgi:hypothetical protein